MGDKGWHFVFGMSQLLRLFREFHFLRRCALFPGTKVKEEKEEVIAPIYEAALSMKPDYDVEKIYELLEKNKKLA